MAHTFYFYDTETSGVIPKYSRIMQFAGQRTDTELRPIGKPDNILIKLTPDVLPDPFAILVHGITPQKTLTEGVSEGEFARFFQEKVATQNTIIIGYNNIRFDDEFIRYLMYRTFWDPYDWHWKDGRSRWDLLDTARMMRALRPDGIKWPFTSDGKPTVSLESMTKVNKLSHDNAHDALGDVRALLSLANLIKSKQPKLFNYLLSIRNKNDVAKLVNAGEPFLYSSGKYPNEYLKTAVVVKLCDHPKQGALVYDLRHDPSDFAKLPPTELSKIWRDRSENTPQLPVKSLLFNRCPAVAPFSVLDDASAERLSIDQNQVQQNWKKLIRLESFTGNVLKALALLDKEQQSIVHTDTDPDLRLYDGFWSSNDLKDIQKVRKAKPEELESLSLKNERLNSLLFNYRARNFPKSLSPQETDKWQKSVLKKFTDGGDKSRLSFWARQFEDISKQKLSNEQHYLLTELQLYVEGIMPEDV